MRVLHLANSIRAAPCRRRSFPLGEEGENAMRGEPLCIYPIVPRARLFCVGILEDFDRGRLWLDGALIHSPAN